MSTETRRSSTRNGRVGVAGRRAGAVAAAVRLTAALLVLAAAMLTSTSTASAAKKLSPAKAVALERKLGSRAAGTYLDRRTGNMVINVSRAATARRVRKAGGIARIVRRSATQLDRITKRIARSERVAGTSWGIDPVANRVVLSIATNVSKQDRARLTRLVHPYGRAVRMRPSHPSGRRSPAATRSPTAAVSPKPARWDST